MWHNHAQTLATLTKLCSTKVKFKWTDIEQKYFTAMKKILVCGVILSYPNFSEIFVIHTNASRTQLGGVISQNCNLIYFNSHKLALVQK